jgi:D-alanyl-D-alanine carboxypeptidase
MKKLTLLSLFAFTIGGTYAQTPNIKLLDSLFQHIEANDKNMGSVSVYKDGKEIYRKSIGFASIEQQVKANAETKYRIGSISKTFTAAIIMQLVDQGKLTLDTRLEKFFPRIPNAEKITIEHLLRHESGLFNFTASPDYLRWMVNPKTKEELIQLFINNSTVFQPGEKHEYSNTNYVLLSFIAEELTGKPYGDILQEMIVKPAKLAGTQYGSKINLQNNEAHSYDRAGDWELARETDPSIPIGAGGIAATASDVSRFYSQLFEGDLVSDSSLARMKALKSGVGLGLFQVPFNEKRGLAHSGAIDGFRSSAVYFPDDRLAVSYLSNAEDMFVNDVMIGVLSAVYGTTYKLPEFKEAMVLSPEELDTYLGVYSAPNFPLKITISRKGSTLMGQGTGQPEFPLTAMEPRVFVFDKANLRLEFLPAENKMILLQGGARFELTRE